MVAIAACTFISFIAGLLNAVAGGGTFFTFPVLIHFGQLTEKLANITSTIGIWPGSVASVVAARSDFRRIPRGILIWLSMASLSGGLIGSLLLLNTSNESFKLIIPWLLLLATLLFAFSKQIVRWAGRNHGKPTLTWTILVGIVQFAVAVYGGYFGAGIGVLMLGGLAFLGLEDVKLMNSLKVLMQMLINAVAIAIFATGEAVAWHLAGPMALGSILGGFTGMAVARQISQAQLRAVVLCVGIALTIVYFWKYYT